MVLRFALLPALVPWAALADEPRCYTSFIPYSRSSITDVDCGNGNYCGLTDVCCDTGCAPLNHHCAGSVGYCDLNDSVNCDVTGTMCCCTPLLELECTAKTASCESITSYVFIGIAVLGVLLISTCVFFIWKRKRNNEMMLAASRAGDPAAQPLQQTVMLGAPAAIAQPVPAIAQPVPAQSVPTVPMQLRCGACNQIMGIAPGTMPGVQVACPNCQAPVIVPGNEAPVAQAQPIQPPAPVDGGTAALPA